LRANLRPDAGDGAGVLGQVAPLLRWVMVVMSLGMTSLLLDAAPAGEAPKPKSEEDIKALYVYNFAKYTTWRTNSLDRFVVGVAGQDNKMLQSLQRMLGPPLKIEGREIVVETYDPEKEHYQVLFFAKEKQWQDILAKLNNKAVLTVGEIPRFSEELGMIELVADPRRGKIEFKINMAVGQAAGLTFDPRLLRMASEVIKPRVSAVDDARRQDGS
jgi:hypothetical protein